MPDLMTIKEIFFDNNGYSDNINKTQTVDPKHIGMNKDFGGWDTCVWQNGDSIYYLCEQGIMEWDNQIGSNLILKEDGISGIVIDDSWLYYFKLNDKKIRRIKLKENYPPEVVFDAEKINSSEPLEQISGFTLYNGELYIKETTISCYLYDAKTDRLYLLNDDMSTGVFFDNKLYFIKHSQRSFSIYATDLTTSHTELMRGDGETYNSEKSSEKLLYDKLFVVNGKLFYSTRVNPAVYLYENDGEDLLVEDFNSDDAIDAMFLQLTTDGKYLYYTHKNTNILHKFDPVESKLMLIALPDDFKQSNDYMVVNNIVYYKLDTGIYKSFAIN